MGWCFFVLRLWRGVCVEYSRVFFRSLCAASFAVRYKEGDSWMLCCCAMRKSIYVYVLMLLLNYFLFVFVCV